MIASMWRKYIAEIQKQREGEAISEEQVGMLVFSSEARGELMNLTLGDVEAFTEGTVQQVLEYAHAQARAETERKLAERERELSKEAKRRQDAEERTAAVEAASAATEQAYSDHIRHLARTTGRWLARVLFVLTAVVLVAGIAFATEDLLPSAVEGFAPALVAACVLFAAVMGAFNLIWGLSLKQVVARAETIASERIERAAAHVLLPKR